MLKYTIFKFLSKKKRFSFLKRNKPLQKGSVWQPQPFALFLLNQLNFMTATLIYTFLLALVLLLRKVIQKSAVVTEERVFRTFLTAPSPNVAADAPTTLSTRPTRI